MSEQGEEEGKGVLTTEEYNDRISKAQETLVRVMNEIEELGADGFVIGILDMCNGAIEDLHRPQGEREELEARKLELAEILKKTGDLDELEWDELTHIVEKLHRGGGQ